MSNFAAVIAPLVISGSRLSDGTPNASGIANFFVPGTNTPQTVYSDAAATVVVSQPVTLDSGGRISVSDFPNGIYATAPVRVFITTSAGATVTDTTLLPGSAGNVGVSNSGWTSSTVDGVLTKIFASVGGQDGKYLEKNGATARLIQDKFREISVSVKDYGAVGNGVAIDTTAIQNALNEAASIGGIVYFPPGSYKVDQALTLTNATSVRVAGAGITTTTITMTNGSASLFSLTGCTDFGASGFLVTHSSSSTGAVFTISGGTRSTITDVFGGGFTYGIDYSATSSINVVRCTLTGITSAIRMIAVNIGTITGGSLGATNAPTPTVDLQTTTQKISIVGVDFSGTPLIGVQFNSNLTGNNFAILGCPTLGLMSTPFGVSGRSTFPKFRQVANGADGNSYSAATGASITPDLSAGDEHRLLAASGGAGTVTVNAPAVVPSASERNKLFAFRFVNGAGGAVTWSLNAVFVTSSAPSSTDGQTTSYTFLWDTTASKLREVSRSVTTT